MNEETKIMGWIGILIWAFIWGFVTEKINESKNLLIESNEKLNQIRHIQNLFFLIHFYHK